MIRFFKLSSLTQSSSRSEFFPNVLVTYYFYIILNLIFSLACNLFDLQSDLKKLLYYSQFDIRSGFFFSIGIQLFVRRGCARRRLRSHGVYAFFGHCPCGRVNGSSKSTCRIARSTQHAHRRAAATKLATRFPIATTVITRFLRET